MYTFLVPSSDNAEFWFSYFPRQKPFSKYSLWTKYTICVSEQQHKTFAIAPSVITLSSNPHQLMDHIIYTGIMRSWWWLGPIMEQDLMVNSAIGFELGISNDFGIMTHRRESLWVDDIERREGFGQRLISLNIRRPIRLMREPDGTHMCHKTQNSTKHMIHNSTNV